MTTRNGSSPTPRDRVLAGFECGITLERFQDIREGDIFEVYETRKVDRALS